MPLARPAAGGESCFVGFYFISQEKILCQIKEVIMAENQKPKYYITTAIAYTSGKPHIGNTYEIVLADAIARYKSCLLYTSRKC